MRSKKSNTRRIFTITTASVLSFAALTSAHAQSWSLSGNAGTGSTNFAGTTDSHDFILKANSQELIRLLQGGTVGIGATTNTAIDLLQVNGGNLRIGTPNSATNATPANLYPTQDGLIFSGGTSFGALTTDNSDPLWIVRNNLDTNRSELQICLGDDANTTDWRQVDRLNIGAKAYNGSTNPFTSRMVVLGTGEVGIGLTNPSSILHTVASGSKTADYVGNLLSNTATSTSASVTKTGLSVSSTGAWSGLGANNIGLAVDVNGGTNNISAAFTGGAVGIGTTNPTAASLQSSTTGIAASSVTGNSFDNTTTSTIAALTKVGVNISSTGTWNGAGSVNEGLVVNVGGGTTNYAALFTGGNVGVGTSTPAFTLDVNGVLNASGGAWLGGTFFTSDARFKTDVQPIKSALTSVLKLQGVTYNWNQDVCPKSLYNSSRQVGFIAQDVEKVVPELVGTRPDGYKGVAYQNVSALLVEAMKSQQEIIEHQAAQIEELGNRLSRLESGNSGTSSSPNVGVRNSGAIDQNIPNPFETATVVPYSLPANYRTATLEVRNGVTGELVKTWTLEGKSGELKIDGSDLLPGSYFYSVNVDGVPSASKRMVLTK